MCSLPDKPQTYPASASNRVTSGAAPEYSSFPQMHARMLLGYIPVRKLVRLGVQIWFWQ